ncbi:MAG: energy-coupling factor ABC transporter ATP-binding protein [Planctomycetota bacterium]|jgi:biotin transport system ATP-binding protein|nr:energy-coupling factor ABC transporter ATP-binding protein [Planctomycetota bacterium]
MLKAVDLRYAYPGRGEALKGVTAAFPAGLTLLAGANGGGKSTLLRVLAGLYVADEGTIRNQGGDAIAPEKLREMSRLVMQEADPQLLGATVRDDVLLGKASSAFPPERFDGEQNRLAARLGLEPVWNAPIDILSYGGRRKLCLLHALLAGPALLLLDEPFAALDYPASLELRDFIAENLGRGVSLVVSTHDLEPLFDIADWLVILKGGETALEGKPRDLRGALAPLAVRPPGVFGGSAGCGRR